MRKLYPIFVLCCLLFSNYSFSQYQTMSTWDSVCTCPFTHTHETIPVDLISCISSSLPEGISVPLYNRPYLDSTVPTTLHVIKDCDSLWVVFAGQGDWYENVLGYYTFPWGTNPATRPVRWTASWKKSKASSPFTALRAPMPAVCIWR